MSCQILKSNHKGLKKFDIMKTPIFALTTFLLFLGIQISLLALFMSLALFALLAKEQQPFTSTLRACMKLHSTPLRPQFSSLRKRLTYNNDRAPSFAHITASFLHHVMRFSFSV